MSDAPSPAVPDLRIVSTGATEGDVAAVTAVVSGALGELAEELGVDGAAGISAWQRSQRPIRGTIAPGRGSWRNFSG